MQVQKQRNGKADVFFQLKKNEMPAVQIERIQAELSESEKEKVELADKTKAIAKTS